MSRFPLIRMSAIHTTVVASALLLAFSGNASARGDAAAGANKAKPCTACHGKQFNAEDTGQEQYPRLAGQYADYIARALHEYKTGNRKNAIMAGMAAPLSDQDIDDIAAYIASQPSKLHDLSQMKR
jgi:cytochrome c553